NKFYFADNSEDVKEGSGEAISEYTYTYTGKKAYVKITSLATTYLTEITVVAKTSASTGPHVEGKNVDGKPDVWDFAAGATELDENGIPTEFIDTETYNNMFTLDIMNSWYGEDAKPGTAGHDLSSFVVKDKEGTMLLEFNGNGKSNHRIRTKNAQITRNDTSTLKDAEGNEYLGYVYSNSNSEPNVYLGMKLDEGDIVTAVIGSNGGDSLIKFENYKSDAGVEPQSFEFKASGAKAQIATFYAPKAGDYKIYSTNEKLVVARVTIEKTDYVTVSGEVTAPESLKNEYGIKFTSRESGAVKVAPVKDGKYEIDLNEKYTYDVSLDNANGYVVDADVLEVEKPFFKLEGEDIKETEGKKTYTYDIPIKAVTLVTVTGAVKGLSD
ncbi:MAG: hypothetical protein K2N89_12330, partial [Lachnospiraceae bacterium]|nr:hypothetical protein [Lachnospiraceae bacterium]